MATREGRPNDTPKKLRQQHHRVGLDFSRMPAALSFIEPHALACAQIDDALRAIFKVDEYIIAAGIRDNEAVAAANLETFHGAGRHRIFLF